MNKDKKEFNSTKRLSLQPIIQKWPMILSSSIIVLVQIIAGFLLLFYGGDWLVDGGIAVARKFNMSPIVIGMTIVAFGTSAPELLVSVTSSIQGSAGIALGNVIGSNIANIGLILGLTAAITPIVVGKSSVMKNGLIMILASFLFILFAIDGKLSRTEGLIMAACLVAFVVYSIRSSKEDTQSEEIGKTMKFGMAVLLVIISCAMLAIGADLLVKGASAAASMLGVSEQVIGLTVVAVGTSLPELAASVAAAIKKQMDISIGNVIGSNIFNILCVIGVSSSISPFEFAFTEYAMNLQIMVAFSAALILLIFPWKSLKSQTCRLGRISALILLACYILYAITLLNS